MLDLRCDMLRDMLLAKNAAYGDSAAKPVRLFSTATVFEALLVRMDDKVSRLSRGASAGEDALTDLAGYAVLHAALLDGCDDMTTGERIILTMQCVEAEAEVVYACADLDTPTLVPMSRAAKFYARHLDPLLRALPRERTAADFRAVAAHILVYQCLAS